MDTPSDFHDWEVLTSDSDPDFLNQPSDATNPADSLHSLDDEIASGGLIQLDYFSLEAQIRRSIQEVDDSKSAESDNPSWIDPGLEESPTRFMNKESCEFWSDSSSEKSVERKLEVSEEGGLLSEGIGEKVEGVGQFYSDSSGDGDVVQSCEVGSESLCEGAEVLGVEKNESGEIGTGGGGGPGGGEVGKRGVVWWKMPIEFLRYCVFRMSPVWSVSVAAAVMGFFILGRRLYKMKRKARGLQIKVAVDDKKASQVMSRAARLNEAFTIVKRVPVIRPSLPALGGTTNWPAMTLR